MICKVKQAIDKYNLINKSVKTVAVGFSGGADSVCLLHVLSLLKDEYDIILKAVHVNHNIRGKEAERDEEFVKQFCRKLDVDLTVFSIDVPQLASERRLSLEECGREVRYECFRKLECDAVAVAHTLSDSIETMLFNLARGTGAKGLAGISPKREPDIIRPLIDCTRSEIEAYCTHNSLSFVTDSTNLCDDYTRNHIRHNTVPSFSRINPDFEAAFMRAMSSIREEDSFVEKCAHRLILESKTEKGYSLDIMKDADRAVLKKSLLEILKSVMNKPPEAKHVDACMGLIAAEKGKIELGKDLYISAKGGIITFCGSETGIAPWKSFFVNGIAKTPVGMFLLDCESYDRCNSFDADKVTGELYISSRLPGDSFTFKNRGLSKTLKKLFNERKIPQEKRNSVAVLHDGENVVWIEDIGVNSMYIANENSQKIITVKRIDKNA